MQQENYKKFSEEINEEITVTDLYCSEFLAFLLVNSSSGSRVGEDMIKSYLREVIVGTSLNRTTFIIYDLFKEEQRIQALKKISERIESRPEANVYIIICGGDGTVEWVIQEAVNTQLNFRKVIFSVLPIGTGNDFAKSIGWGNFQFGASVNDFQKLAKQLRGAKIGQFDIWESSIECYDSGSIVEIKNGIQVPRKEIKLVKNFTNYFGIGTDAQVAYIAQKLKAKTIALKRLAYGFAGLISFWMFCGGLAHKISQIFQLRAKKNEKFKEVVDADQTDIFYETCNQDEGEKSFIKISKSDCCVTFLNSTSSMDLRRIWETPHNSDSNPLNVAHFKGQSVDDGMIQIVSYRNEISLWLERAIHMAKKVGQGNGPFFVNFREPVQGKPHPIYVHINGEPYRIMNAKSITVSHSKQFPDGKIKVLYRTA